MNLLSNLFKKKKDHSKILLVEQEELVENDKRSVILPPGGKNSPRSPKHLRKRENAGNEDDEEELQPTIYCISSVKGLLKTDRKWITNSGLEDDVVNDNFPILLQVLNFLRRRDLVYYKLVDSCEIINSNNPPSSIAIDDTSSTSSVPSLIVSKISSSPGGNHPILNNNENNENSNPNVSTTPTIVGSSGIHNGTPTCLTNGINLNIIGTGTSYVSTCTQLTISEDEGESLIEQIRHQTTNPPNGIIVTPTSYSAGVTHSYVYPGKKKRIDSNRIFLSPGNNCKFPEEMSIAIDKLLNDGNPKEHYKNLDFEAKGGFGSVFAAKNKNPHSIFDKQMIALKKMPHKTLKQKRMNLNEIGFMKYCNHPNLVKFLCSYQKNDELWLIMEFMEGGTLREAISSFNFCEEKIAFICREILQGISYMHKNGLCHRDLKSSNIMISMKGEIKIIDFGLAIDFNNEKEDVHMCGSPFWMPPEQILGIPHSFSVDIWSFGVCVAEMMRRKVPNHTSRLKAMMTVATEGLVFTKEQYPDWSDEVHDFLEKCLQFDPTQRATADELLKHRFLSKACPLKDIKEILPVLFMSNTLSKQGYGQYIAGIQSGTLNLVASSNWDSAHTVLFIGLNYHNSGQELNPHSSAWKPAHDSDQYIIAGSDNLKNFTHIKIQGRADATYDEYVKSYKVEYSNDGISWNEYNKGQIFKANSDRDTIVTNALVPPIMAKSIKILPIDYHNHVAMRLEIIYRSLPISITKTGKVSSPNSQGTNPPGERIDVVKVTFDTPFPCDPIVTAAINMIDQDRARNTRSFVDVANVTQSSFDLKFYTWADSINFASRANWIATCQYN
eukprot:gene7975-9809_t